MQQAELIFFGSKNELPSALLQSLNILSFLPASEQHKGLYLKEIKYNTEQLRKLDLELTNNIHAGDWFVYRQLTAEKQEMLKQGSFDKNIYVLAHQYAWHDEFCQSLAGDKPQNFFVLSGNKLPQLKTAEDAQLKYKTKNILALRAPPKTPTPKNKAKNSDSYALFFLAALIKLIFNPSQEINQYLQHLKYSQKNIGYRALELVLFLHFIIQVPTLRIYYFSRHMLLSLGNQLYIAFCKIYGFLYDLAMWLHRVFRLYVFTAIYYWLWGWVKKRLLVPLANFVTYTVRHYLLLGIFKTYGFVVIVSFFIWRIFKLHILTTVFVAAKIMSIYIFNFIKYRVFHYFKVGILFKVYGVFYDFAMLISRLYIVIRNFFKFNVLHLCRMFFYKFYGVSFDLSMLLKRQVILYKNIMRYRVSHIFLMCFYKAYGILFDVVMFLRRVLKLYLLYPFFKVYWFTHFQYNKRIKKYFKNV